MTPPVPAPASDATRTRQTDTATETPHGHGGRTRAQSTERAARVGLTGSWLSDADCRTRTGTGTGTGRRGRLCHRGAKAIHPFCFPMAPPDEESLSDPR